MYQLYKTRKKNYGKLKKKERKKKSLKKSYIQIMLIFENIQTSYYLHTQKYICIYIHNNTTRTCLHYHS